MWPNLRVFRQDLPWLEVNTPARRDPLEPRERLAILKDPERRTGRAVPEFPACYSCGSRPTGTATQPARPFT